MGIASVTLGSLNILTSAWCCHPGRRWGLTSPFISMIGTTRRGPSVRISLQPWKPPSPKREGVFGQELSPRFSPLGFFSSLEYKDCRTGLSSFYRIALCPSLYLFCPTLLSGLVDKRIEPLSIHPLQTFRFNLLSSFLREKSLLSFFLLIWNNAFLSLLRPSR